MNAEAKKNKTKKNEIHVSCKQEKKTTENGSQKKNGKNTEEQKTAKWSNLFLCYFLCSLLCSFSMHPKIRRKNKHNKKAPTHKTNTICLSVYCRCMGVIIQREDET